MGWRYLFASGALLSAGALVLVLGGCGDGHDHSKHGHGGPASGAPVAPEDPAAKPYPLDRCVVSGEALGAMGKPHRIVHEGQEVKLCCSGCEKDFRKDPAPFMKKISEAAKR